MNRGVNRCTPPIMVDMCRRARHRYRSRHVGAVPTLFSAIGTDTLMSQFLSQSMGQHMRLEQRLTPQLIQSMAILQKSVTDLEAHIADALESNAALELAEPETKEEESTGGAQSQEDEGFARLDGWTRNFEMEGSDRAPPRLRLGHKSMPGYRHSRATCPVSRSPAATPRSTGAHVFGPD